MSTAGDSDADVPLLRVVHGGDPGPEALAALVVALSSVHAPTDQAAPRRSGWADRRAMLRHPLDHGPGRWVASSRPAG
ncbi:MAG TPA: acyl-CoA carboxylase subunit epsilon [Mycobacteriales bacterium]|nr:acyl-CoA carboxylase subunit epsilon [Mycobacteriales bacterium]